MIAVLLAALTPLAAVLSDADLVPVVMAGVTIDLLKVALFTSMGILTGYLIATVLKSENA